MGEGEPDETPVKWQPVMLITEGRIECNCGALAVFVILDGAPAGVADWDYTAWCQYCFEREQQVELQRKAGE